MTSAKTPFPDKVLLSGPGGQHLGLSLGDTVQLQPCLSPSSLLTGTSPEVETKHVLEFLSCLVPLASL